MWTAQQLLAGNGANVRVNAFAQQVELPEPKSTPLPVKEEASFAIPMPFMAEQVGSGAWLSLQLCGIHGHARTPVGTADKAPVRL